MAIKEGKWLLINKIHQYLKSMNESVFQYAGFWRRFEAMLIDSFILLIFQLVIVVSLVCGAYVKVGYWPFEEVVNQLGSLIDILWFILIWVYFAGMESSSTQATFGKMVLGLQVTDIEGNRISFLRATGRNMAKILSTAILSIGYLMAAFTKKKQALHDLAADCLVNKQKESSFWKLVFIAILFAVLLTGALGAYVYYIKWPQWVKATEEALQDAEEILLDPEKMFEPSMAPIPEKTKVVKESTAPRKLTQAEYEKLLSASPPTVSVSGSTTTAGPALLELSTFFGSKVWVKVYIPPIPNLENKLATLRIIIDSVLDQNNKNFYDAAHTFEKEFFQKVSFSHKTRPVAHLEGIRTVNFLSGLNETNISSIKGKLIMTLPINITLISFKADETNQEKNAAGSTIKLLEIQGDIVKIHYTGKAKNYITTKGYNSAGEELAFASKQNITATEMADTNLITKFKGNPVKVDVLVAEKFINYEYPFTLKR